jgi:hypothetical protein
MVVAPTSAYGVASAQMGAPPDADHLCIRDTRLALSTLVNRELFQPDLGPRLHEQLRTARPFEHLVVEGWFNPALLELIHDEFDLFAGAAWKQVRSRHEDTRRSAPLARFGPATQLYFAIVHSGWFVDLLSAISGVPDLIPDPFLHGGGMHETRAGGGFGIHRDFDRHLRLGLSNRLVFITYLNKRWEPEWDGALELWDAQASACVRSVEPELGRSILMKHGSCSYHGHPRPLKVPEGRTRRSVAAYYYTNAGSGEASDHQLRSQFLFPHRLDGLKRAAKLLTPPIVWMGLRKLVRRPVG